MITVTKTVLADNSTQYHVTSGDINGRLIKSVHAVDFFGFDFAGGHDKWQTRAELYAMQDTDTARLDELRTLHAQLLQKHLDSGADSMDIFFNRCGRFTALKEITARFNLLKAKLKASGVI